MAVQGTEASELIIGLTTNDVISGLGGNDLLDGGKGNDAYLLGLGSGRDVITDYDTSAGNLDVVQFTGLEFADITSTEKWGYDLVLNYGPDDQLTIVDYYKPGGASQNRRDQVR